MWAVFCCHVLRYKLFFQVNTLLELLGDGAVKVVTVGNCYIYLLLLLSSSSSLSYFSYLCYNFFISYLFVVHLADISNYPAFFIEWHVKTLVFYPFRRHQKLIKNPDFWLINNSDRTLAQYYTWRNCVFCFRDLVLRQQLTAGRWRALPGECCWLGARRYKGAQ